MLIVHRAERADRLAGALAEILHEPLDDPFESEVAAVPTRGIERWLSQQLANVLGRSDEERGDGICANVAFPFPRSLTGDALCIASGVDPRLDPWAPQRAVWPLLEVIDRHSGEPWLRTVGDHLGGPSADATMRARRYGTARHLTDLFDRYGVHRPAMIEAWAAGDDADGEAAPLPPDLAWQAELWRRLRDRLAQPSPAERLGPALAALRDDPALLTLPRRLALFGITRLAPSVLRVVDAIAAHRDVHLMLLHPSPVLWGRVASGDVARADARNPLLTTWGRDARELQLALAQSVDTFQSVHLLGDDGTTTLLGSLQDGVREDRPLPGVHGPGTPDLRAVLRAGDRSVQVHSCHGRARQVEVLRDALLHLFEDDPTLEPRDVIVMCPDIESFAPLIEATFAEGGPLRSDGGTDLRVRLADRSLRQTNPVLGALAELLELGSARITSTQLLDFASLPPVRRRFHLDDDALERLEDWVTGTGIRWGLDAAHRRPFALDALDVNTWHSGIDRLLLGVAMTEEEHPLVGGVLPLDDVDSGDIVLAGRLAELVERLRIVVDDMGASQPIAGWATSLAAAAEALFDVPASDVWQRTELDRLLVDVVEESAAAPAVEIGLVELRALLADRLRGRPGRVNFRTGSLTACTLVPMRSVPHRVVGLLGLDDGDFPRHGAPDGDDIVARAPIVGDHDVRSEDRQLLLDALMAARDHVVVTFSGRDERTNSPRPPSVPIGELLDVVDATALGHDGRPARDHVLVEHPLQPFDRRNFEPGRIVAGCAWSFDTSALAGARAAGGARSPRARFNDARLPAADDPVIELDDLVRFAEHPTKAFLRQRLGITVGELEDELAESIPIELDGLGKWGIGDRLLQARVDGACWTAVTEAEVARGLLPPGLLGGRILDEVTPIVETIHSAAGREVDLTTRRRSLDVRVGLPGGSAVVGTVGGVRSDVLLNVTYSRLAAKHRIAAWVRFLALAAGGTLPAARAVSIGRARGKGAGISRFPPIDRDVATAHLDTIVDLYRRGMCEPLPIYCNTSEALARRRAAHTEWETTGSFEREDRDPAHVFVLGKDVPFARLRDARPRADESGPGWADDEPTRIGRYARRLWGGPLEIEERVGV